MARVETIAINESREINRGGVSVRVVAEPLVHHFDAAELGRGPAEAIRKAIVDGIAAIGEPIADATRARRQRAGVGGRWLFVASGRLLSGIAAELRGETWTIAAPPDRLTSSSVSGGAAALATMLERLRDLVPAIRDPATREVRAAIAQTIRVLIRRGR